MNSVVKECINILSKEIKKKENQLMMKETCLIPLTNYLKKKFYKVFIIIVISYLILLLLLTLNLYFVLKHK